MHSKTTPHLALMTRPPHSFFLFFRTAKTVTFRPGALSDPPPSEGFAGRGLSTQADPYIHEVYVSSDAVGSGNGFGEISVASKPPVPRGGVLGGIVRWSPRFAGSGVSRPYSWRGRGESASMLTEIPSHIPLIAASSISVP